MKKWYFDIVYNHYIATAIYKLGGFLYKVGDQGLLELIGPQGFYKALTTYRLNQRSLSAPLYLNIILTMTTIVFCFIFFYIYIYVYIFFKYIIYFISIRTI